MRPRIVTGEVTLAMSDDSVKMSDKHNTYKACLNVDHDMFACERPRGHDGPHRALLGTNRVVEWGDTDDE